MYSSSPISTCEDDIIPSVVTEIGHSGRGYGLAGESEVGHCGAISPRQDHQSTPALNQYLVLDMGNTLNY